MPANTQTLDSVKAAASTGTTARPGAPSLDQVLSSIAVDSKSAPETYLRETEVPHGGE